MKVLIFTDNHFCRSSSILNRFGNKYFERIENQLNSLNWLEKKAVELNCDEVWCLGDFFNKPDLNEDEITALKDIKWNNLPHKFLVGNHESAQGDLKYTSVKVFENPQFEIINKVKIIEVNNTKIAFLPYFSEQIRPNISEVVGKVDIILSHNDLAGINFGPIVSTIGFNQDDILENCKLFINGHLHNGSWIKKNRILNLGSLTGQTFGEEAFKYAHNIAILDTDSLEVNLIENPYAYNFYKIEVNSLTDLNQLKKIKNNAVLSIKCNEKFIDKLNEQLELFKDKIINYRVVQTRDKLDIANNQTIDTIDLSVNPTEKFIELCKIKFTNDEILFEELTEICK